MKHEFLLTLTVDKPVSYDDLETYDKFTFEYHYKALLNKEITLKRFVEDCVFEKVNHLIFSTSIGQPIEIKEYLTNNFICPVTVEMDLASELASPKRYDAVLGAGNKTS